MVVQSFFVHTVAKKFDIPTLDLKVYDDSKTEIDEDVFEFIVKSQDLGVLEICLPKSPNLNGELSFIFIHTSLPVCVCIRTAHCLIRIFVFTLVKSEHIG